jgi:hypothetical protein
MEMEVLMMKYRTRIYYTEEQKALMWDRWQLGDSLHEIARLFDRHHLKNIQSKVRFAAKRLVWSRVSAFARTFVMLYRNWMMRHRRSHRGTTSCFSRLVAASGRLQPLDLWILSVCFTPEAATGLE